MSRLRSQQFRAFLGLLLVIICAGYLGCGSVIPQSDGGTGGAGRGRPDLQEDDILQVFIDGCDVRVAFPRETGGSYTSYTYDIVYLSFGAPMSETTEYSFADSGNTYTIDFIYFYGGSGFCPTDLGASVEAQIDGYTYHEYVKPQ